MSRLDNPLSEIHAGTHLVIILEASILRDSEKLPVIAKDGSNGIKIRFNDNKLNHDKVFWTKSSDFKKLCAATESDMKKAICPELRGKSLWMCVKEIRTMAENPNGSCDMIHVSSTFEPFDYLPYIPQMTKPIISGDPCQHPKGEPLGVFVEYVQQEKSNWVSSDTLMVKDIPQGEYTKEQLEMQDVVGGVNVKTGEFHGNPKDEIGIKLALGLPPLTQEQQAKLALGKEIIAKGEANKDLTSLNEKNTPKEEIVEKDVFEEEAEPHPDAHHLGMNGNDDDDWGDL